MPRIRKRRFPLGLSSVASVLSVVTILHLFHGLIGYFAVALQRGRKADVAVNTAKAWLSVLEARLQVFLLPPFRTNVTKRPVKAPQVYYCRD